jgi:hypothetical protein
MPESEIEINAETGEMETTINGIAGRRARKPPKPSNKSSGRARPRRDNGDYTRSRKSNSRSRENFVRTNKIEAALANGWRRIFRLNF